MVDKIILELPADTVGGDIVVSTETRERAEQAAAQAEATAAGMVISGTVAGDNLVLTKADSTTVVAGDVRGPKGNDGSNVLPTDEAIAQAIVTPGSETQTQLNATNVAIAEAVQGVVYPAGAALGAITHMALQDACDAAALDGKRVWAAGEITTDQTLVVTSDADLSGLTIHYTGSGSAVQLGTESGVTFRLRISAPRVIAENKVGSSGWAEVAGTVGIYAVNLNSCSEIVIPHVQGFETGMLVYGAGQGNSYNTFLIGHLANNKINQRLSADSTGWSNQNTYVGGRYGHNSAEGSNMAGVRQIEMVAGLSNPINNNTWLNPSLEGDTAQYIVDFAGTVNVIINGRYEATTPRVRWQDAATGNLIMWGYNANAIVETFGTGAFTNQIIGQTWRYAAGSATGVILGENSTSSSNPFLTLMAAGARASGADPATAWRARFGAVLCEFKPAASAHAWIGINSDTGRLLLGNGTSAPNRWISHVGSNAIQVGGASLVFNVDNTYDIGLDTPIGRPRYVRAGTAIQTGAVATGARPTAVAAGAGAMIFDTTLAKPIWSTGSGWVDATGATV